MDYCISAELAFANSEAAFFFAEELEKEFYTKVDVLKKHAGFEIGFHNVSDAFFARLMSFIDDDSEALYGNIYVGDAADFAHSSHIDRLYFERLLPPENLYVIVPPKEEDVHMTVSLQEVIQSMGEDLLYDENL